MPQVTKHSSNNLVTVSYPVREVVLDITKAEHDLIVMFSKDKVKMINFIRGQYNLGLYDAQELVDTVIASVEAKPEVQVNLIAEAGETEVDWSKVKKGTWIYVKDYPSTEWRLSKFVKYSPNEFYPFTCKTFEDDKNSRWKYAKFGNT